MKRRKKVTLSDLLGAVPAIAQLVTQIERPGYGKLKRETVRDIVFEALIAVYEEVPKNIEQYIGIVVDDLVRMFNETGQFVHEQRVEVQRAE